MILNSNATKMAIFIDCDNTHLSICDEGYSQFISRLRDALSQGRELIGTFIYVPSNCADGESEKRFHHLSRMTGVVLRTEPAKKLTSESIKHDLNVQMFLDAMDCIERQEPQIAFLVTENEYFASLARWLKCKGIRVEVGSATGKVPQDLRDAADNYLDLCELLKNTDIRNVESAPNVNSTMQAQTKQIRPQSPNRQWRKDIRAKNRKERNKKEGLKIETTL